MNLLNLLVLTLSSPRAAAALPEAAGKSFLILAAAFLLALWCRRGPAATRHFIWLAALAGLLALPLAIVLAPRWSGPAWADAVLRPRQGQSAGNDVPARVTGRPGALDAAKPSAAAPRSWSPPPAAPAPKPFPWRSLLLPGWAAGVVLALLVFLEQRRRLRKIQRAARPKPTVPAGP